MPGCYEFICSCLPAAVSLALGRVKEPLSEIRLRADRPVQLLSGWESGWLTGNGMSREKKDALFVSGAQLSEILFRASGGSMQSAMETLAAGYLPLPGGGRLGAAGNAGMEGGRVRSVYAVNALCFRIPGEYPFAAEPILRRVKFPASLLLAGKPMSGKTTVLRSLLGSLAQGMRVAVADERGEFDPLPERAVSADRLGYPKAEAITLATRSLSPELILCDELSPAEEGAVRAALFSGVPLVASIHAGSREELMRREWVRRMLGDGLFEWTAFVRNGKVEEILRVWDGDGAADSGVFSADSCRDGRGGKGGRKAL